ncbi:heme peroxidase [Microthyrium microscopicum]|uniref:Peroxidase n=1 Tax=Microthyrium microscopicum TaxID=703497 RepID=A0A6A6UFE6_9PEZI|nr:heme peroxidase [Microthyrium microscopicum]
MWNLPGSCLLLLSVIRCATHALQTWPSSIDELEDIMFLNTGYRNRGFGALVTPCGFTSTEDTTRSNAAEWLRTAFHDMANIALAGGRNGGLDASLVYELGASNIGAGFETTLRNFVPYYSTRSSMADIIALGVYASVRSCGGPVIPIRTGRKDAIKQTGIIGGTPLPQNDIGTFVNQFHRMGFNQTEMIQLVACGHTIGVTHSNDFPEVVSNASASNAFQSLDSTRNTFDSAIAQDYLNGSTTDALSSQYAIANKQASDFVVFNSDNNATITPMADPTTFQNICQSLLQRMIEVVVDPSILTDPIEVYDVKPAALQLSLMDGGDQISFTGEIRVRTTSKPIDSVQIMYWDRIGIPGPNNTITTTLKGTAQGFEDQFSVGSAQHTAMTVSNIGSFMDSILSFHQNLLYHLSLSK